MLTMDYYGVEISIAGCIEEMVRDPNPIPRGCPYISNKIPCFRHTAVASGYQVQ